MQKHNGKEESQKIYKKTRHMPREQSNYSLTKTAQHDTMIIHTVILCLSLDIPSNMVILPQDGDVVKMVKHKNDNVA
jgi:hypothetical protein